MHHTPDTQLPALGPARRLTNRASTLPSDRAVWDSAHLAQTLDPPERVHTGGPGLMNDSHLDRLYDELVQAEAVEEAARFVIGMSDDVKARAMYEVASEELTTARRAYDRALEGALVTAVGASA